MSISGIGSYGAGNLSQMLATLLSELNQTSTTSTTSTTADDTTSTSATSSDSSNALTGSTRPSLSSMILGMLIGLQQQSSDSSSQTSSSSSSSSDPVQNLFSAMDSNSDGTVSQSELESYIENEGGTQSEADSLYTQLNQSGSSNGISEKQLASEAPPAPPPGPPPGGGNGGPPGQSGATSSTSSSDLGSEIVQALDTSGTGSVSKSEFESYVTANGGTTAEADTDFSDLDTSNSDLLTSSNFTTALEKLEDNMSNGTYSPALMFLDALSQNASSTSSVSITV